MGLSCLEGQNHSHMSYHIVQHGEVSANMATQGRWHFNSLAPGIWAVILNWFLDSYQDIWNISGEIALRWIPQDLRILSKYQFW